MALPFNYFKDPVNLAEITALMLDPKVSIKTITNKYGFSKTRLYQIITANNLPTKHRDRINKFKDTYGNNPDLYRIMRTLEARKSYHSIQRGEEVIQNATIEDLLVEGSLPRYCPVFGIELRYDNANNFADNTASIDKI